MNFYSYCPIINTLYLVKSKFFPKSTNPSTYFTHKKDVKSSLQCLNFDPAIIEKNIGYTKSIYIYAALCDIMFVYFKSEFNYMNMKLSENPLVFGAFVNDKDENADVFKGFCGWDDESDTYRMYINLQIVPFYPLKKTFTYLFDIAKHEMAHLFLHAYDNEQYPLNKGIHDDFFINIMSEIDNYFYNKNELLQTINNFIVKK